MLRRSARKGPLSKVARQPVALVSDFADIASSGLGLRPLRETDQRLVGISAGAADPQVTDPRVADKFGPFRREQRRAALRTRSHGLGTEGRVVQAQFHDIPPQSFLIPASARMTRCNEIRRGHLSAPLCRERDWAELKIRNFRRRIRRQIADVISTNQNLAGQLHRIWHIDIGLMRPDLMRRGAMWAPDRQSHGAHFRQRRLIGLDARFDFSAFHRTAIFQVTHTPPPWRRFCHRGGTQCEIELNLSTRARRQDRTPLRCDRCFTNGCVQSAPAARITRRA